MFKKISIGIWVALILALGIGGNTAIFSLANAIIFRDDPIQNPEEIVHIYRKMPGFDAGPQAYPDFVDIRDASMDLFDDIAGTSFTFRLAQRQS